MFSFKQGDDFFLGRGLVGKGSIEGLFGRIDGQAAGFYELFCYEVRPGVERERELERLHTLLFDFSSQSFDPGVVSSCVCVDLLCDYGKFGQ